MRYAETPLARPQCEMGCDYGHGKRSVLARDGDKDLLHIAGQKHWGGIGKDRHYAPAEVATWDGTPGTQFVDRQRTLFEGRMTFARLCEHQEAIFRHFGRTIPLNLIFLGHTLLLDEPGTIDGPPARPARRPPQPRPRVRSEWLYQVADLVGAEDAGLRLAAFQVVGQKGGNVTIQFRQGTGTFRVDRLDARGLAETPEGAKQLFLAERRERVAEAERAAAQAAGRLARLRDELDRPAAALADLEPIEVAPKKS